MKAIRFLRSYFSALELALWGVSTAMILLAFFAFDREQYLTLAASLIGATSLIFNARATPWGRC